MTERWEYLAASWIYTAEMEGEDRVWRQHISISRAGRETKKHEYWNSEKGVVGPNLLEVLNELGAKGWELATDTISDSTVITQSGGWGEVGTPTIRQCILKRRL